MRFIPIFVAVALTLSGCGDEEETKPTVEEQKNKEASVKLDEKLNKANDNLKKSEQAIANSEKKLAKTGESIQKATKKIEDVANALQIVKENKEAPSSKKQEKKRRIKKADDAEPDADDVEEDEADDAEPDADDVEEDEAEVEPRDFDVQTLKRTYQCFYNDKKGNTFAYSRGGSNKAFRNNNDYYMKCDGIEGKKVEQAGQRLYDTRPKKGGCFDNSSRAIEQLTATCDELTDRLYTRKAPTKSKFDCSVTLPATRSKGKHSISYKFTAENVKVICSGLPSAAILVKKTNLPTSIGDQVDHDEQCLSTKSGQEYLEKVCENALLPLHDDDVLDRAANRAQNAQKYKNLVNFKPHELFKEDPAESNLNRKQRDFDEAVKKLEAAEAHLVELQHRNAPAKQINNTVRELKNLEKNYLEKRERLEKAKNKIAPNGEFQA